MNSSVGLAMANNGSYSNDRTSAATDIEFATDPASGSFFNSDYKKYVVIINNQQTESRLVC